SWSAAARALASGSRSSATTEQSAASRMRSVWPPPPKVPSRYRPPSRGASSSSVSSASTGACPSMGARPIGLSTVEIIPDGSARDARELVVEIPGGAVADVAVADRSVDAEKARGAGREALAGYEAGGLHDG